jgi:DNA-binding transcriptional LysR family regulator
MRPLSIDQLRTLALVVELGSFSGAARRLNLTQPAVSLQLRELESLCGVRLVERLGKTVLPTAAGRRMLGYAKRITAEADRALDCVRAHRDGHVGTVHLGTGPTVLAFLLPSLLQALRARYPKLELIITTGTTIDIVERLMANTVDIGFTALPVEERELEATPVRIDEFVAILPASETDIPDRITPADVDRRALISEYQRPQHPRMSRSWMQAAGFEPRPALVLDTIEARIAAVAAGLGMGFIPKPATGEGPSLAGTVLRPLDPPLRRTLGLVQRRDRPDNAALRLVREAILTLSNLPCAEASASSRPARDSRLRPMSLSLSA